MRSYDGVIADVGLVCLFAHSEVLGELFWTEPLCWFVLAVAAKVNDMW